jgi:hypothetical protein
MPGSYALVEQLRSAGIAAVISGAGPSVLAIVDRPLDLRAWAVEGFDAAEWSVDQVGAVGTREPLGEWPDPSSSDGADRHGEQRADAVQRNGVAG